MRILKISQLISKDNMMENIENPRIFNLFKKVKEEKKITWKPESNTWIETETQDAGSQYKVWSRLFSATISSGMSIVSVAPSYSLYIEIQSGYDDDMSKYSEAEIVLRLKNESIGIWRFAGGDTELYTNIDASDKYIKETLPNFADTTFGIPLNLLVLPVELKEERQRQREMKKQIKRNTRLTRAKRAGINDATAIEFFIEPKKLGIGHKVYYQITNLEKMKKDTAIMIKDINDDGSELTHQDAINLLEQYVSQAKNNKYVDETNELQYIPVTATPYNFDFVHNTWKGINTEQQTNTEDVFDTELLSKTNKQYKISQNFEGYFSGDVPDYATQFLGTSSVEASQISSMFGKANEAINLVNQFDSSLLYNVSFIFNFAKSGAYGVYLSELDRAIKTKALQKKLEQKGYEVKTTDQGLTAFPKQQTNISPEDIQKDIDSIYADLESKGGTAIGINMNAVLTAAKQDAIESGSKDPEIWQWITVLHLGGTIAHEAVHAKGSMSEGPSEQIEQNFTQWALPKINDEYKRSLESQGKGDQFTPLTITGRQRHAKSDTWYKTAQLGYYMPRAFVERATGSDLNGRFPTDSGLQSEMGMQGWSMLAQQDQGIPLESRLGRQFMSKIPKDLSQEHNSIEEQLRKYTREYQKLDQKASMEELLSAGWDDDRGYTTLEGLLNEKRPKPLLVPLKKNSSNIVKTANQVLNMTPFMAEEISIDFENNEEHYDDPNDYRIQVEKTIYEKLTNSIFDFTDEELLMIGETLRSISGKDIFIQDKNAQKQLFDIELQLGMWVPITEEKAKEQVRNGIGVRMSNFPKVNGVRYDYNEHWDNKFHIPATKPISVTHTIKPTSASQKHIKTATLFGWMNNLDISDGSTIPGLGDRVMAWEDRDEDFSEEEDWIKQQPRYNPNYDIKGFYYRWIEPHFAPQLFDDMTRDYSNTHPAKRFASVKIEPETARIFSILSKAKSKISSGDIISTRFILTEDVMPLIDKLFSDDSFKINVFHYGETDNQGDIFAVWVSAPNTNEESIERAEKHLQRKTIEKDVDNLIDGLTGISKKRNNSIQEIIDVVKDTCSSIGVKNFFIVGSYPRDIVMSIPFYAIDNLEFRGGWADQYLKIGGLVAEKLGISNVSIGHHYLSFVYNNISINFSGDSAPKEIKSLLIDNNIEIDPKNIDLFNRDFTINMLTYDIMTSKVADPTGKSLEDLNNKTIRTVFDPEYICKNNPIVILRALKLKIRHNMGIDPALQKAMINNAELIFDGRYSDRDLIIARENVKEEGIKEATELFKVFAIEDIEKVS